jgi:hypothetical protein
MPAWAVCVPLGGVIFESVLFIELKPLLSIDEEWT